MKTIFNFNPSVISHPRWNTLNVINFHGIIWVSVSDLCRNTCRTTINSVLNTIDEQNLLYIAPLHGDQKPEAFVNKQGIFEADFGRSPSFIKHVWNWIVNETKPVAAPSPERIVFFNHNTAHNITTINISPSKKIHLSDPAKRPIFKPYALPCCIYLMTQRLRPAGIDITNEQLLQWLCDDGLISRAKKHRYHPLLKARRHELLVDNTADFDSRHPLTSIYITPKGQSYIYHKLFRKH